MDRFEYVIPKSLSEAAAAMKAGAVAKAGGIDLVDRMKERIVRPKRVASLACGRAEPRIVVDDTGWWVSAFATLSEVASSAELAKVCPALVAAAADAATPQIRNVATVAGNVLQENRCWYYRLSDFDCHRKGGEGCPAKEGRNEYHAIFGDGDCPAVHASNLAPVLMALGATVEIHGVKAARPVESLWQGPPPGLVTGFRGERTVANAYVEVRHRQSFDWALASAAVAAGTDGKWTVVLGAVAPVPWRAAPPEEALGRGKPTAAKISAAAEVAVKGAKPLSMNGYKVKLAKTALVRALTEAAGGMK
jgi:xanthine dehydrogenase YagS FAD-binding subunit